VHVCICISLYMCSSVSSFSFDCLSPLRRRWLNLMICGCMCICTYVCMGCYGCFEVGMHVRMYVCMYV